MVVRERAKDGEKVHEKVGRTRVSRCLVYLTHDQFDIHLFYIRMCH